MTTITKELLAEVRKRMDAALAQVAKDLSLKSLTCGRCTYNPSAGNFTMKVEGVAEGGMDETANLYAQNARFMGLPPIGAVFADPIRKEDYKIIGMKKGGRLIVERTSNGKHYLMPADQVKRMCALDKRIAKKEAA